MGDEVTVLGSPLNITVAAAFGEGRQSLIPHHTRRFFLFRIGAMALAKQLRVGSNVRKDNDVS